MKLMVILGGLLTAVLLSACQSSQTQHPVALPRLSVQLWSVKADLKQDFAGTLKQLAVMGFDAVEFAGDFGPFDDDPNGLRQLLQQLGLQVSGAHVGFADFSAAQFHRSVAFHRALKTPVLIIPADERAFDATRVDELVAELTDLSKRLQPYGIKLGFHNHDKEFGAFQTRTFWDYIATATPQQLVLQLDVGWVAFAGLDPVTLVERYPGRTLTTHYKAKLPPGTQNKLPFIGQDTIDWRRLLNSNMAVGGTQWLVIEQEDYPPGFSPMQALALSKQGIDQILGQYE